MADLFFIEHALTQMQDRHISEDQVYHVVEDADEIIEREDGRTVYIGMLDDGRDVVVVVEDDGQTVVTVWNWKRRPRDDDEASVRSPG